MRSPTSTVLAVALTLAARAAGAEFSEAKAPPPLPDGAIRQLWAPEVELLPSAAPVAFSPDRKTLALGAGPLVVLWDATTGKEFHHLKGHADMVTAIAFAPDGRLATAGLDRTVRLWDAARGTELRCLTGHTAGVNAVAFAPDGKTLASAGEDRIVRLWDASDGTTIRQLPGHHHLVTSVAFAPDGKTLASASKDRTIRLWDTASGKETRVLRGHQNRVNTVLFGSDGRAVASASQDSTARLWDADTGRETRRLCGWSGEVRSAALSADGRTMATVGRDQTIRLWEVLTGEERRAFRWDGGHFLALALAGDGRSLAAARPGSVVLWDVTGLRRDGQPEAQPVALEASWAGLAKDAPTAHRAVWRLALTPEQSVPFLAEQLHAQAGLDAPPRIAGLVADLYDDRFTIRTRAADELEALGRLARPALDKELAGRPSLDVRRRIELLLERMDNVVVPPMWLRAFRAVEALELSGTREARQTLEKLAAGAPGARLTEEARAAARRMNRGG